MHANEKSPVINHRALQEFVASIPLNCGLKFQTLLSTQSKVSGVRTFFDLEGHCAC